MDTITATRVTVDEIKERLDRVEEIVFLDTRNPAAWAASDVKLRGALRIPVDELTTRLTEVPRDHSIVTYCT